MKKLSLLLLATMTVSCAQSRRGVNGYKVEDVVYLAPQCMDQTMTGNLQGEFCIEVNLTDNLAYVDVYALSVDPREQPYRVMAKKEGDDKYDILASGVTSDVGSFFVVEPSNGFITDYYEWYIETELEAYPGADLYRDRVEPGLGLPLVHSYVEYPDLLDTLAELGFSEF